mgnify:CR=1 FL=1
MSTDTQQAAPTAPAIPSTASVVRFALDELRPSPANPRRIRPDDPALRELADSLRTLGQIEPIVVRAIEGPDIHGEILAGERRWRAAKLAGLSDIECKVLHCDDRTALEITVVENLQRQDLHPLEEARGVRSLLDAGWPVDEIASHLGKSARWVVSRAAITQLSPAWLDGLAKGDKSPFAWAGVAHLELIARLPEETQEALAAHIAGMHYGDFTVEQLARHIDERWLRVLSAAPWKLDDATLVPAAGACAACSKRSSCQQVLFADLAKKDRCLDVACWNGKVAAHTLRKAAELRQAEERVVILTSHGAEPPKDLPKDVPVVRHYDTTECKKSDPGAVKAIMADSGRQVWVKADSYASKETRAALGVAGGSRERVIEAPGTKGGYQKVQEYRRIAKRFAHRYAALGAAADGAKRPADDVLWVLVAVLIADHGSVERAATWKTIAGMEASTAREKLWQVVRERLPDEHSRVLSCSLPDPAAVEAMEQLVGLDPKQQLAAAVAEHPDPKPKGAKLPASAKPGSGKVAKTTAAKAKPTKAAKAAKTTRQAKPKKGAA